MHVCTYIIHFGVRHLIFIQQNKGNERKPMLKFDGKFKRLNITVYSQLTHCKNNIRNFLENSSTNTVILFLSHIRLSKFVSFQKILVL